MVYGGWGVAAGHKPLPQPIVDLLQQGLGVTPVDTPAVSPETVELPPVRLGSEAIDALAAIVGPGGVQTDDAARLLRIAGKSTPDLLQTRAGSITEAVDAVLLPASHQEILALLRECARRQIAVVPFGGGTSVVGGVRPSAGDLAVVVSLDLRRLDALLDLDEISQIATVQAGLRAPELESMLADAGWTLGHFPQSYEFATIGGFAATRSSGQSSAGYGRFDDLVVGVKVATPQGELSLGKPGGSAAGPDLKRLFLGSEGVLGVITEVMLRIRPLPAVVVDESWRFDSFASGIGAFRSLAQSGQLPTVARLSDEVETAINLAQSQSIGAGSSAPGGCLAVVAYEGSQRAVDRRREDVTLELNESGGQCLGEAAAAGWRHGRFAAPYLRDSLLDVGALVETLETSTSWVGLHELYGGVRAALSETLTAQGTPALVMCHVSHVYPTGASLYFTVVCASAKDPVQQWYAAKAAALDVMVAQGATITHHHAVGVDHKAWMTDEIGILGVQILRAVKAAVDPQGILNPGKLIP